MTFHHILPSVTTLPTYATFCNNCSFYNCSTHSGDTVGDKKYGGHRTADWGPMVKEAVERMEVN